MRIFLFICSCCALLFSQPVLAGDPIKLAAIFSKSSKMAFGNRESLKGVRRAVDEINRQGGLLGRQIELIEFDNQGTALGSKHAAEQAVRAGVVTVIGANLSSHSLAMAPVLQNARIPMISPISTNPQVTLAGNYIFRICFIDPFQGVVLAHFALNDLDAKTAGLFVNVDDTYSEGLANFFRRTFTRGGGKVLFIENYLENTADFSQLFKQIRKHEPDVVFHPGHTKMSALVFKQAGNEGLRATFLGGDGWNDSMYTIAGSAIEGSYYSTHWHPGSEGEKSREFVAKYMALSQDFIPATALSEDCVNLFADAVRRAQSTDPTDIRNAIAATRAFNGITGTIRFNENGDPIKPAVILKFDKGTSVYVKSVSP